MGLYEGRGALTRAMKDLMLRWQETKENWDDPQTREFEESVLVPLESDLKLALGAMDQMTALLNQCHRDCD